MSYFQKHRKVQISEMRPYEVGEDITSVSISQVDRTNGSPKIGDMIARNPENHEDQWLVAKDFYDRNYQNMEKLHSMTFGDALLAAQQGLKIAREGWNGKGMFLILNGGYSVPKEALKPSSHINEQFLEAQGCDSLVIGHHLDMWTAQKTLCVGWLASQTDMQANDWCIVE